MKAKRRAIAPVVFCFLILAVVGTGSPPFLAAQDIVVESADPPAAEQGTVNLDVEIKGSRFERGATAKFFVSGTTDPGGITVNSTTFKGRARLIANITVAEGATISKFDIEVQSNGRIGKGIELFQVNAATNKGETGGCEGAIRATFRDHDFPEPPDRVRSDGLGPYEGGKLGVIHAEISKFRFSVNLGNEDPGHRQFTLDFSDVNCASSGRCNPPDPNSEPMAPGGILFAVRNDDINPDVNFCTMANGDILGGVPGRFDFFTQDDPDRPWFLVFSSTGSNIKALNELCSDSSFLSLKRVDDTTWEFSLGPDQVGCLLRKVRGRRFEFHGNYLMPFLVKAERLP